MADQNTTTIPEGMTALDTTEARAPAEPDEVGMTTMQKVGVGVGVAGATGLALYGLYRAGSHFGWWGQTTIIIDEDDVPKDAKDTNGSRDRSSGSRDRAIGKPPNISRDPQGYNTTRFPAPGPVRLTMRTIGYKVDFNNETLVPNGQPNGEVRRFQNDWNTVIRGIDAGKVKLPSGVEDPAKLKQFRGILAVDGIPGKNTLNALEIAWNNWFKNGITWRKLVEQGR